MEDSTSPSTKTTSLTAWPTPAVPGEGIPWRRRHLADTRSPASGTVEHSMDAEAHGDRPRPSVDAAVGDRPRGAPGTRSPHVPVPESTSSANPQANAAKSGTGPQEAVVTWRIRRLGERHAPGPRAQAANAHYIEGHPVAPRPQQPQAPRR
ncbi:hypothetical protein GCM10010240_68420 [Streptomyces griseoviridis]|nr:hypothetical protein GCM10010240_68420 [Streptomyces griseoviridis]